MASPGLAKPHSLLHHSLQERPKRQRDDTSGNSPIGAVWYRGVLKDQCSGPPSNSASAVDSVNYAVVLPAAGGSYTITVSIDGTTLGTFDGAPGLNYNAVPGLAAGTPKLEVKAASDGSTFTATGTNPVVGEVRRATSTLMWQGCRGRRARDGRSDLGGSYAEVEAW